MISSLVKVFYCNFIYHTLSNNITRIFFVNKPIITFDKNCKSTSYILAKTLNGVHILTYKSILFIYTIVVKYIREFNSIGNGCRHLFDGSFFIRVLHCQTTCSIFPTRSYCRMVKRQSFLLELRLFFQCIH